jgi:hypothetical protein
MRHKGEPGMLLDIVSYGRAGQKSLTQSQREYVERTVRRAPEVVINVSGGARTLGGAIWYAAHHAAYYDLVNVAVYATVVDRSEIYCCGDHYDFDYIVNPKTWWKVDVPAAEFRLNRPR